MNIAEEVTFDKDEEITGWDPLSSSFPWMKKLYLSLVIMLTAGLAFGLGRLSVVGEKAEIKIEYDPSLQSASVVSASPSLLSTPSSQTSVVASKNGQKYHYPHCSGAKQIAEANKITFENPAAAEASGYTLASNCRQP